MTQAKGTIKMENVYNTIVIVLLVIVGLIGIAGNMNNEAPVVDLSAVESRLLAIETNQVNTAAGEVVVDNSIMEAKIEGFANILDDLMDNAYSDEVTELKENGSDAFEEEYKEEYQKFGGEEIEEILEGLIPGFDELSGTKYKYFNYDDDFGDDGVKYTIINLGLDDEDDREIIVERLYNIRYELKDSAKELKVDVLVTGTITFDDDGDAEADLVFTLA